MRIAVFSSNFPNISQTFVINQIVGLIKLGAEVDIITNDIITHKVMHESVQKYNLLSRVICNKLPSNQSKLSKILMLLKCIVNLVLKGQFSKLINVLSDSHLAVWQKVDLIYKLNVSKQKAVTYTNIICHFGQYGYYVCKLRELGLIAGPISTVFHGQEVSRYKMIEENLAAYKKLFVHGDLMLPISDLWKNKLIEWGCAASKIKVHRMGVDILDFNMRDVSTPLSTPLKVIQVGRLTDKKAIIDSINAVLLVSDKMPIDFTIIGDGDLYDEAERLIQTSGAASFIHLLGKQPQEVVKQKLDESDVFLLPSIRAIDGDMEGIPVALMEAMAKGLITLSTYHSGIPELIENNVSGFLVQESKVNELADALLKINNLSVDEVEQIRIRARRKCEEHFNNETLNKTLFEYY